MFSQKSKPSLVNKNSHHAIMAVIKLHIRHWAGILLRYEWRIYTRFNQQLISVSDIRKWTASISSALVYKSARGNIFVRPHCCNFETIVIIRSLRYEFSFAERCGLLLKMAVHIIQSVTVAARRIEAWVVHCDFKTSPIHFQITSINPAEY